MKIKNKNKKSKIFIITIFFIFILILIATILILQLFKNKNNDVEINDIYKANNYNLPSINTIDYNENPMLYDFLNGSLGYNFDKNIIPNNGNNFTEYGTYFAILQENNHKDYAFISYYNEPEEIILPILGTDIYNCKIENFEKFYNSITSISKNRVFNENYNGNSYTMYIVSLYNINNSKNNYDYCSLLGNNIFWGGINLTQIQMNLKPGIMSEKITNNGWPSEWLRKEPFINTVKKLGLNMYESFWDENNYLQTKIYKSTKGEKDLLVKTVNENKYEFEYENVYNELEDWELEMFLYYNNFIE